MTVPRECTTTTRLVHRAYKGAVSWWHSATVCDLPGAFSNRDLMALHDLLPSIKKIGFNAILLRLSLADIADQEDSLVQVVDRAHFDGLKVLVRISTSPAGEELSPTGHGPWIELGNDSSLLVTRTRQLVEAGVDGVDLGMIDDDPDNPDSLRQAEHFSYTVNQQLAEVAAADTTVILTAQATRSNPELFERHVTEDWFHHLRDDALFESPWAADELAERVRLTYAAHDPLGQVVAWRPSQGASWDPSPDRPGVLVDAWADRVPDQRFNAMMAFVAALPGAVYLPFQQCGGSLWEKTTDEGEAELHLTLGQGPQDHFRLDLTSRILGLRSQRELALGTLAMVEGMDWSHPGISVHLSGHLMVVLNASDDDVLVPSEHTPVLYSDGFATTTRDATVVAPNTCAWFVPAETEVVDPISYH